MMMMCFPAFLCFFAELLLPVGRSLVGFVLFCFVLFCFVLFCFVLFCFVLFWCRFFVCRRMNEDEVNNTRRKEGRKGRV